MGRRIGTERDDMLATGTDTTEIIAGFLRERFPMLANRVLADETPLLASGAIDSLGILELMAFLGDRFGIEPKDEDFDPANFDTLGHLARFVERARA
jgi:acyl carrier protein